MFKRDSALRLPGMRRLLVIVAVMAGVTTSVVAGGRGAAPALQQGGAPGVLERIGAYIEDYYSRAQSIVADETVLVQPLAADLAPLGFARRVVNELRVEWNPQAADPRERATAVRQMLKVSGPTLFEPDQEECADPPSVTPEPLAFLLPANREQWRFQNGKGARVDGRSAVTLEYRPRQRKPVEIIVDGDCLFTDLSGHTGGRLWIDETTGEILRMEEQLLGYVDVKIPREHWKRGRPEQLTYQRVTTSIRYSRVVFTDPEETLLLPASIDTTEVYSNPRTGTMRLRISQQFANYRRFVTASRIVP